jgi:DNA-binding XRE family transcriptional regulator
MGGDESKDGRSEEDVRRMGGLNDEEMRRMQSRIDAVMGRSRRGNDAVTEPEDDLFDDDEEDDEAEEGAPLMPAIERLFRRLEAPRRQDAGGEGNNAWEVRSPPPERRSRRPGRARTYGGADAGRPRRGRRLRRWGDAARQARMERIASTGEAERRSLRAVREMVPMSQRELAYRTGLSRATISEIELGRRRPHPKTMRLLARSLGVDVGQIAWP